MPQNPISDEDLLKKPKYKSIMYLLENYSNKDKQKIGLNAGQLLYALKERNGNFTTKPEMEEFFTKISYFGEKTTLQDIASKKIYDYKLSNGKKYIEEEKIYPGCIKNSVHLNDCLKVLIKREWVEPVKGTKSKYYRYKLTHKWYTDKAKRRLISDVKRWKTNNVIDSNLFDFWVSNKIKDSKRDEYYNNFILFGLPCHVIYSLDEKEKSQLNSWVEQASVYLNKIMELKYQKMKVPIDKYLKLGYNEILELDRIGFYFSASKTLHEPIENLIHKTKKKNKK